MNFLFLYVLPFCIFILFNRVILSAHITCQKVGSVILDGAGNLSSCYDMATLLREADLQVSYVLAPPYIATPNPPVKGADILILNSLRDTFGFAYHLKKETNFGRDQLPNGAYFGILASVSTNYYLMS
jgi:hypothetical protein